MRVLLLNADYTPIEVISWERAITLLLEDKADAVTNYVGKFIRSATAAWEWPAVVALREYWNRRQVLKLSRANVLARDGYVCQYCGKKPVTRSGKPDLEDLTIDHVIPRAHSKNNRVTLPQTGEVLPVTSWRNLVCACRDCNFRKADRTPEQAKMTLKRRPSQPNTADVVWMMLSKYQIPEEWKDFLPADSPWREYWDVELVS